MTEAFGQEYASAYDLLYADKDYDAECDVLEEAFQAAGRQVKTVLDLGCGTGAHAVRLAKRGYSVIGVDLSSAMLQGARERLASEGPLDMELVEGDIRYVRLGRTFDAVICMFAVLGYQTSDQDVIDALRSVRSHLAPGGQFVFDIWYGPAVEAVGPETRVRVIPIENGELERQATASLAPREHLCTVSYRLTERRLGVPERVAQEDHRMRYFFRDELNAYLSAAGMSLQGLRAFPELDSPPSASTWNVLATVLG